MKNRDCTGIGNKMDFENFSVEELSFLRNDIKKYFSTEYRLTHTLGVELESVRLGELFAPEKISFLRAAALLHDITKENTFEKQLQICQNQGIIIRYDQKIARKTLHSITAAAVIPLVYPRFNVPEVVSSVRYHTTGRADMGICEKIIYLADYIEQNRTFEDCVMLRSEFWGASPEKMSKKEALEHLDNILIKSFDMTIKQLLSEGVPIDSSTTEARNYLLAQKAGFLPQKYECSENLTESDFTGGN